jgi:NADH dehydrogenase FAD-containing subunit
MFSTTIIILKFLALALSKLSSSLSQKISWSIHRWTYKPTSSPKNVVVIGASFAGYHAARQLAHLLPTGYRVVVIEPNSHFNFTWAFPRFAVVGGSERKAFIPYGGYLSGAPKGSWELIKDSVVEISKSAVRLKSKMEIEYAYLVVATGCKADAPSRLNAAERDDAVAELKSLQGKIERAGNVVVVGGGPAGVELAADAKAMYPKKNVTLVHSRKQLLHAFGSRLHDAAMVELERLGVRVVLGERPALTEEKNGSMALSSGETLEYDLLVSSSSIAQSEGFAKLCRSDVRARSHRRVLWRNWLQTPYQGPDLFR